MKKAVVTGATSMLGIATIKHLLDNGIYVYALSRANSRRRDDLPKSDKLLFFECELADIKNFVQTTDKCDVFYHFGWGFTDRSTRDDERLQAKNVEYTLDAIELAKKLGCTRFIGAGSQAEYGFQNIELFEDSKCFPKIAYGKAKLKAYELGKIKCKEYGMDYIWTRTFSVFGRNDSLNVMTSYAISKYKAHEEAKFSSGMQNWNYLFEEDAGEYFYRLGFCEKECFGKELCDGKRIDCIVNVGNIQGKKLKEYVMDMATVFGDEFKYEFATEGSQREQNGIFPNVSRLINITEYLPKYTFEEGIRTILGINEI